MRLLIVLILVLMVVGAFPAWPHSHEWGYYPTGGFGGILLIVVILMLLGVI